MERESLAMARSDAARKVAEHRGKVLSAALEAAPEVRGVRHLTRLVKAQHPDLHGASLTRITAMLHGTALHPNPDALDAVRALLRVSWDQLDMRRSSSQHAEHEFDVEAVVLELFPSLRGHGCHHTVVVLDGMVQQLHRRLLDEATPAELAEWPRVRIGRLVTRVWFLPAVAALAGGREPSLREMWHLSRAMHDAFEATLLPFTDEKQPGSILRTLEWLDRWVAVTDPSDNPVGAPVPTGRPAFGPPDGKSYGPGGRLADKGTPHDPTLTREHWLAVAEEWDLQARAMRAIGEDERAEAAEHEAAKARGRAGTTDTDTDRSTDR